MVDHSVFVRTDLPADYLPMARTALGFTRKFQTLESLAVNDAEGPDQIIKKVQPLAISFVKFQDDIILKQMTGHMYIKGYPSFHNHLVRESQYYLAIINQQDLNFIYNQNILYELIFWLRQSAEHASFLMAWADPYERNLKSTAEMYSLKYYDLLNKATLYVSLKSKEPVPEIPSPPGTRLGYIPPVAAQPLPVIDELAAQAMSLTIDYRRFLTELKPLIQEIKVLGLITTLFIDHQTREEDYFLAALKYYFSGDANAFIAEYGNMPFAKDHQEMALYLEDPGYDPSRAYY